MRNNDGAKDRLSFSIYGFGVRIDARGWRCSGLGSRIRKEDDAVVRRHGGGTGGGVSDGGVDAWVVFWVWGLRGEDIGYWK